MGVDKLRFVLSCQEWDLLGNAILQATGSCAFASSGKTRAAGAAGCTLPGLVW